MLIYRLGDFERVLNVVKQLIKVLEDQYSEKDLEVVRFQTHQHVSTFMVTQMLVHLIQKQKKQASQVLLELSTRSVNHPSKEVQHFEQSVLPLLNDLYVRLRR